jgi:hypothetical protein
LPGLNLSSLAGLKGPETENRLVRLTEIASLEVWLKSVVDYLMEGTRAYAAENYKTETL